MANFTNMQFDHPSLSMILRGEPKLYDLHTHLLGMGNAGFWVDTILMNRKILPTDNDFKHFDYGKAVRRTFCPLIWEKTGNTGFVEGAHAAEFFYNLVENNILPVEEDNILPSGENNNRATQKKFSDVIEQLEQQNISPALLKLINKEFNGELLHRGLNFKEDFSYDVVLKLSDLARGLGVKQMDAIEFEQLAVTEKLVGYLSPGTVKFRDWIIFNARKQKFEIVYGIQVEELRDLITINPNIPNEARKLARAYIINAFSMCDAQGSPARLVDFHSFQGSFTPEFYPRRFALKDSIYEQRLDVLAALIAHIIERYQTSLPPVGYCEFSVGVGDLSKQWMFDVLRSVPVNDKAIEGGDQMPDNNRIRKCNDKISSFSQFIRNGHFPHLKAAFHLLKREDRQNDYFSKPTVIYKFLAGFDRRKVQYPLSADQKEALHLLYDSPQQAILLMMKRIVKSTKDADNSGQNTGQQRTTDEIPQEPFAEHLKELKSLKDNSSTMPDYYNWVVGLDLFGDELGYPYCPFVERPFIEYVQNRRTGADDGRKNDNFGLRIHCGENVIYADDDSSAYRLFIAHMYIVFRCLRFLQRELKKGIRIGHGIAFDRILGTTMSQSRHRKSSVLLAEMREHANYLFKTIAFEVNITSNEYLLGQILRQGDFAQALRLDALFKLNANIILGTDDDGVWPLDQCKSAHPGHHSLLAEYCRAISSSMFNLADEQEEKKAVDRLENILTNTRHFCFSDKEGQMPKQSVKDLLPLDDLRIHSVIIHPDIIRLILNKYKSNQPHAAFENYKIYSKETNQLPDDVVGGKDYRAMRMSFICICANHDEDDADTKDTIWREYFKLFNNNWVTPERMKVEFEFIYQHWRKIRSEFIFRKESLGSVPSVEIQLPDVSQRKRVVYSEPLTDDMQNLFRDTLQNSLQDSLRILLQENLPTPLLENILKDLSQDGVRPPLISIIQDSLKNSLQEPLQETVRKSLQNVLEKPLQDMLQNFIQVRFIDFLKQFTSKNVTIYAFAQHMDIEKTVATINESMQTPTYVNAYNNVVLYIYMNKNKYKYKYNTIDHRFKLRVNPTPLKRDRDRQNFLYALCHHASAATSAIHLVSELLYSATLHTPTSQSSTTMTDQTSAIGSSEPIDQHLEIPNLLPSHSSTGSNVNKKRQSEELESEAERSSTSKVPKKRISKQQK